MKSVLAVVPFENLYPPMNGGMQRAMNLLHQLSRSFELTAIIQQDADAFRQSIVDFPHIKNCTVLSTQSQGEHRDLFSVLPSRLSTAIRYRYWNRSLKGPASQSFLTMYPLLKKALKEKQFDYILLEDLAIVNLARLVRRYQKKARIIYDAYNVNSRLAMVAVEKGESSKEDYEATRQAESTLTKYVDSVFTCSDQDLSQLKEMNDGRLAGVVIPNGTVIRDVPAGERAGILTDDILFCGSLDYLPNKEGLLWFCKEVLPYLVEKRPSVRMLVVGRGDPGEELAAALKHGSVVFYGQVDRVSDYYRKAALAIVPLLSGSGTRLKLLEAMGNRVAVVSTAIGAEGIGYTDGKNIVIADEGKAFADAIIQLLSDREWIRTMADEAFAFVKSTYDWDVIGDKLKKYLI